MQSIKKLFQNEAGATTIEYCLIAAMVVVSIITAVGDLGQQLNSAFPKAFSKMNSTKT